MKWKVNHVAVLLMASTLAMIGLVIFQYKWIAHSKKLSDEIFAQRASMALCSTIEEYSGGSLCNFQSCQEVSGTEGLMDTSMALQNSLVHDENFQSDLRKTLDFYNIGLSYQMTQCLGQPANKGSHSAPSCVVNVPAETGQQASFIKLDFPEKRNFLMGNLKYMIGSSVLILLFTAFVLLLANWWLLKQKRLLQTNVEIYNNMAHEFRTPLTNIGLAAELMSKDKQNPQSDKFLDIITRENAKLIQQVERVLHLARLDNKDYALRGEPLNLKNLLQSVCDELGIQIEQRHAIVQIVNIPDHLEIFGDRQHLSNVFRNLIDNALKYAVAQPTIIISTKEEKDGVMISVEDNGVGIPSTQSEFIFDKFHRVQHGNLHEQKGFGLGLAYVKRIVELHKGFVQVDSEINRGSRFDVYLPKMA